MARTFQIKRGAKENMPILAQGELGFVTDSGAEELHIGTGSQNIQIARQDAVAETAKTTLDTAKAYSDADFNLTGEGDTLTWDGNIDGKLSVTIYENTETHVKSMMVKISDIVPTEEDLANGATVTMNDGTTSSELTNLGDGGFSLYGVLIAPRNNYVSESVAFPEAGIWVSHSDVQGEKTYNTSLTIPGYTGFQTKKLKEELLPDSVKNHTHTAEEVGAFPIEGGAITGQNVYLNNGTGRLMADGDKTQLEAWDTAGDDSARRILTVYDKGAKENIAEAIAITDRKDGINTEYKLYGEHNKPTPAMLGAVSNNNGIAEGSLRVQDSTNKSEGLYQNSNHRTIIGARDVINDGTNERMLQITDATSTATLTGAIQLIDKVDDTMNYYNVIHEGNKELIEPSDIGAAPAEHTHTADEVGALPIEGGAITGASIYLNNGTGRLMANGDAAQIEAWTTAGDDSERRILTMYDKGAKADVASSLVLTDRVGSINTEYKIYGEHNKPKPADIGAVTLDTAQTITGTKTFDAPTNVSQTEQATTKFKTSNGGAIIFGKEGANSGTMIRLDQADGTCRLRFRSSITAGAMVWEQPEQGAQLYIDLGKVGVDHHRITFPSSAGTLALTSHTQAASTVTAGTFAGQVNANAGAAATVGTAQVRDIYAGTSDMTAGSSSLATGTLYFVYE